MPKHKKLSLIKRLSWPGWQGWVFIGITLAAVGASLTTLPETIEKNKLKNYYHNALTFYADTSGNGKIESEEENRFIQDFVSEIRHKGW